MRRAIPRVFILISIFYLIFAFSLEERRMIGDERGWDPGSRALPIGTGVIMLATSIYLTLREKPAAESPEKLDEGSARLILLTIALTVFYILLFRTTGFILSTNALLFTLIYFNYRKGMEWHMVPGFGLGFVLSSGFVLLIYSLGRFITRSLVLYGKRSDLELFSGKLFTSGVTVVILALIFLATLFISGKITRSAEGKYIRISALTAPAVTEILYLVFKQIFLVRLAKGLITW
ncbi:MAG: tripartite tricarboxylate transporter TctB family protein [Thermodesulfobacteriota bacterium]|jgi:hypothetical protein